MSEKRATVVVDDTDDDHEHHHTINTPAMNSNASFATSGASTVSSVTFKKRDGTELPFALPISGPGLVVMLADSDAGSLIVSAQSGKVWGYALVPLQFVMVAPLFMAQELSVRLGVCSGKGLSNLIGHHFGKFWSSFISVLLVLICQAALISEYTAIVGVAEVVGIQKQTTIPLLSLFMFFTVAAGTYQQVETGALALGCMEFVFFITVIMVHPSPSTIVESIEGARWNDKDLQILAAANIGAIMQPWMIFYQQSAIVDKGVKTGSAMRHSQRETIYGAWITQAVAASVMITAAGTVWGGANASEKSAGFDTIPEISETLTPYLGVFGGKLLFCMGFLGSAAIGAVVVSLTAMWSVADLTGTTNSLNSSLTEAPVLYGTYALLLIVASTVCLGDINTLALNVGIQVVNALFLPVVLSFIYLLATSDEVLPSKYILHGSRKLVYLATFVMCSFMGIYCSLQGMF